MPPYDRSYKMSILIRVASFKINFLKGITIVCCSFFISVTYQSFNFLMRTDPINLAIILVCRFYFRHLKISGERNALFLSPRSLEFYRVTTVQGIWMFIFPDEGKRVKSQGKQEILIRVWPPCQLGCRSLRHRHYQ